MTVEQHAGEVLCWTTQETMDRLKIGREHVRKLVHSGELAAFKIGHGKTSDMRITEESILAFIERNKITPTIRP
ncbi:MAG TPA: helix-turn-helix domain-containing protein [Streptosporangiaceae bacterium]|nr:helix-turn-helix domain-containing protein [Streptosporangiaceae bacterium]